MKTFRISPSNIYKIVTGETGLTENQTKELKEFEVRDIEFGLGKSKPLTEIMRKKMEDLTYKRDNPQLPKGAISYLKEWYISKKYNRKKEWFSKFVDKGLAVESDGIDMLSIHLNEGVELKKESKYFEKDFIHGFPDVLHEDWVFDTKCVWDVFGFPFYEDEIPDEKYEWQMHGYMYLCDKENAAVVYCLIDTPKPLVDLDLKKLYFQSGGKAEDWHPGMSDELRINYTFQDIPIEDRIKLYEFKKDKAKINLIIERVKMCRDYINKHFK